MYEFLNRELDARAKKDFLVGYAFRTKVYRIWIPESDEIVEISNVSFNESSCGLGRGAALG